MRDIVNCFNVLYGKKDVEGNVIEFVFVVFEVFILKVGVCVMLLFELIKKMLKLDDNCNNVIIFLEDLKLVEKKIKCVMIDGDELFVVKYD